MIFANAPVNVILDLSVLVAYLSWLFVANISIYNYVCYNFYSYENQVNKYPLASRNSIFY